MGFKEKKNRHSIWFCECDCGKTTTVRAHNLISGHTKSCGCFRKDKVKSTRITHGMCNHPLYTVHRNMMNRCYNPNNIAFPNYGARGIRVCERWKKFENFVGDMLSKWKPELTIDRIDVDGNYEPSNCRWATREIQQQNQRTTKLNARDVKEIRILHKEEPNLLNKDIAQRYNVSNTTISFILNNRTWKNIQ